MTKQRGKFITVEGGEGVGKSTNIAAIKSFLEARNISYIQTREPGGTAIAEKIRQLLLDKHDEKMDSTAELLLVFAARAQHLQELIVPALNEGNWILCDRFTDATYAYQGAGRNLDTSLISKLESIVQNELRPDLTVILDLDPHIGLERAKERGELDRFELEQQEFFEKVRSCYLEIAEANPKRCIVIDASKDIDQVKESLLIELDNWFVKNS